MDQSEKDAGTIAALMSRFKDFRLPKAKLLLDKVDSGEVLSDSDIRFLKRIYEDGKSNHLLVQRNPEYHALISKFLDLYTEIITKGLENERAR